MRRVGAVLAAVLASIVLSAGTASAVGHPGSCTISGGTVHFTVNESPAEGDVSYISFRSPVRLDLSTSAHIYNNEDVGFGTYYAFSSPIDGDGWWNYRINVYWVHASTWGMIDRTYVNVEQYGSASNCHSNVYQ